MNDSVMTDAHDDVAHESTSARPSSIAKHRHHPHGQAPSTAVGRGAAGRQTSPSQSSRAASEASQPKTPTKPKTPSKLQSNANPRSMRKRKRNAESEDDERSERDAEDMQATPRPNRPKVIRKFTQVSPVKDSAYARPMADTDHRSKGRGIDAKLLLDEAMRDQEALHSTAAGGPLLIATTAEPFPQIFTTPISTTLSPDNVKLADTEYVDHANFLVINSNFEISEIPYMNAKKLKTLFKAQRDMHLDHGPSEESKEWHTNQIEVLRKAAAYFLCGVTIGGVTSNESASEFQARISDFVKRSYAFEVHRMLYEGSTLMKIPFGEGQRLGSLICPDEHCSTCEHVLQYLKCDRNGQLRSSDFDDKFLTAPERGCPVGSYRYDSADMCRTVYWHQTSEGDSVLRIGRFTAEGHHITNTPAEANVVIRRADVVPSLRFPGLVSSKQELALVFEHLTRNANLPQDISDFDAFLDKLSHKEREAMRDQLAFRRLAAREIYPLHVSSRSDTTGVPIFAEIRTSTGAVCRNKQGQDVMIELVIKPKTRSLTAEEVDALYGQKTSKLRATLQAPRPVVVQQEDPIVVDDWGLTQITPHEAIDDEDELSGGRNGGITPRADADDGKPVQWCIRK